MSLPFFYSSVLNTDNMSIVGVTIDYGPYGFMDRYDPEFVCNASDNGARYTYAAQPEICKWNLGRLAEALRPVLPGPLAEYEIARYDSEFQKAYLGRMRAKLGLRRELPEARAFLLHLLHERAGLCSVHRREQRRDRPQPRCCVILLSRPLSVFAHAG